MAKVVPILFACLWASSSSAALGPHIQKAAAIDTSWALRELDGRRVADAKPETATIRLSADHKVFGTSVCNYVGGEEISWNGDQSASSGTFDRNRSGATITTAARCADARAMALGHRFWAQMTTARAWSSNGVTLTIWFADGSKALFAATSSTGS